MNRLVDGRLNMKDVKCRHPSINPIEGWIVSLVLLGTSVS